MRRWGEGEAKKGYRGRGQERSWWENRGKGCPCGGRKHQRRVTRRGGGREEARAGGGSAATSAATRREHTIPTSPGRSGGTATVPRSVTPFMVCGTPTRAPEGWGEAVAVAATRPKNRDGEDRDEDESGLPILIGTRQYEAGGPLLQHKPLAEDCSGISVWQSGSQSSCGGPTQLTEVDETTHN